MIIINVFNNNQVSDCEMSEESLLVLANYYGCELEAMEYLAQGLSPDEVARELDLY